MKSAAALSSGAVVDNAGLIEGGDFGLLVQGIGGQPQIADITNSGTIRTTAAEAFPSSLTGSGLAFRANLGSISVTNSGLIEGERFGILALSNSSGFRRSTSCCCCSRFCSAAMRGGRKSERCFSFSRFALSRRADLSRQLPSSSGGTVSVMRRAFPTAGSCQWY